MTEVLINIKDGILATSLLEWIAVFTGIIYVVLAAKKSIWCWSFALVSAGSYVYICYGFNLYLESFLQLFYVLMAIVGWYFWNKTKNQVNLVISWSKNFHFFNIAVSTATCLALGYYFEENTDQAYPYLDAFTTVFSLSATYMVTQRVLENWVYWMVVDVAAIFLYAGKGLLLTSVLYLIFTVLAIVGFIRWRKIYKLQFHEKSSNHRA